MTPSFYDPGENRVVIEQFLSDRPCVQEGLTRVQEMIQKQPTAPMRLQS